MARRDQALPDNAPGDFFVDRSCIDCDTCRQIAPATFRERNGQSIVHHQPELPPQTTRALMALVACPTGSIGAGEGADIRRAIDAFPTPIAEGVYYCGFNAESSFGAWSYLITRPASHGGNVMIDAPRWTPRLAERIEEMGGIDTIVLTHRDDVADHARWAARFGATRLMHENDHASHHGVERVLTGDDPIPIDDELMVIPTPGHTRGHVVLLHRDTHLFTGDHLSWSPEAGTLRAHRDACWFSWRRQIASMELLRAFDFEWVLPGHGRIGHASAERMREHLERCIEWMKEVA